MPVGEDEGFYRMDENGSYSSFPPSRLLFYIMTERISRWFCDTFRSAES